MHKRGFIDSMSSCIVNNLQKLGYTVATAESCTGGMVASSLVNVPGCSDVLHESYVTYSDEAKHRLLGVSLDTLEKFSAVSEQCAREMAEGVRSAAAADFGVATTGYAGPGGGTEENPVGTVYIAVASDKQTTVFRICCEGDRFRIRKLACIKALILLHNAILDTFFDAACSQFSESVKDDSQ